MNSTSATVRTMSPLGWAIVAILVVALIGMAVFLNADRQRAGDRLLARARAQAAAAVLIEMETLGVVSDVRDVTQSQLEDYAADTGTSLRDVHIVPGDGFCLEARSGSARFMWDGTPAAPMPGTCPA